jgi:uncharacterized protein YecE (DUF72 family)
MLRLGSSGFSYKDWVGPFYPQGLPERERLAFYAREFDTVELNVTFYRPPSAKNVAAWVERTPPDFTFAVKAFRGLTHERAAPDFAGFVQAVQPLAAAGKLACVLAQFPQSFHPTPANEDYLARLREGLGDLPAVVEFRDAAWVTDATFERLRALGLGFACVDEPRLKGLMPPIAVATGPVGYVRFHGRNARQWYKHEHAWQRYDYNYSRDELAEWVPKLRALDQAAPLTLVYFNNAWQGQGLTNARTLRELLAET